MINHRTYAHNLNRWGITAPERDSPGGGCGGVGGDSHMEQTGMLVGYFEFNP